MSITKESIIFLIREKEQEKAKLERELNELKIQLADIILGEEQAGENPEIPAKEETEEDNGLTTFVTVCFKSGGKTYDYIWDGAGASEEVRVGDTVKVEARWGGLSTADVVGVRKGLLEDEEHAYKCAYPLEY